MHNKTPTLMRQLMDERAIPLRHVVYALEWEWGVAVSLATVSRWAAGLNRPRWDVAIKVAELFETTPDLLFSAKVNN